MAGISINSISQTLNCKKVIRIKEVFDVDDIGWSGSNYFYRNIDTMEIEMIEQNIHPRLPKVKVEYYLKY